MPNKFKGAKSIKQRYSESTKRWTFQVFIQYVEKNGKRANYTRSFSEKDYGTARMAFDAAIQHRDQMMLKLRAGTPLKGQRMTVQELFEKSKEIFQKRLETNRKKGVRFNKYIAPYLGGVPIDKITAIDIFQTLNSMIDDCTDDTIMSVYTIWKEIFKTARIMKQIDVDVTEEVIAPKSQKIHKKKPVVTDRETLERVIEGLRKHRMASDKFAFDVEIIIFGLRVMYETGLRPCECFALDCEDIDLNNMVLYIHDELGSSRTEANVKRTTKTKESERVLPITERLKKILLELMAFQDSDRLFANWEGKYFRINDITCRINRICKLEGIEFNMYRLRHLFSTDLITNQTDPRTVMELMGHNNTAMTLEYARSNNELKLRALEERRFN